MEARTTLLAVIASAVLLGCSSLPGDTRTGSGRPAPRSADRQECPSGNCPIRVTVDPAHVTATNTCGVRTPTIVSLGGLGGGRSRLVVWTIQDPNYGFSTLPGRPALVIKGSNAFFNVPEVHGAVLQVRVNVSNPGTSHEYGLNLVRRDGTACGTYDPWMIE